MHRFVISLTVAFGLLIAATAAFAQADLTQQSRDLIARLAAAVAADPQGDHAALYLEMFDELDAAAQNDPSLPLVAAIADSHFRSENAVYFALLATAVLKNDGLAGSSDAVTSFLGTATNSAYFADPTTSQLAELGGALSRLKVAGFDQSVFSSADPVIGQLVEAARAAYEAANAGGKNGKNDPNVRRAGLEAFVALVPATLSPALAGPAGTAFVEYADWNGRMWDAATAGVDIVTDALNRGEVDQARLAEVTSEIETLAGQGPWGGNTGRELLRDVAENIPGAAELFDAVWPKEEEKTADDYEDICKPINCDCENLTFDIGGVFHQDCLAWETEIRNECRATGSYSNGCHPTASGPAAFPPG
jgi:hypothetical protein